LIINFNVSEEDYANFNADHFFKSKKMKGVRLLGRFMPILGFAIVINIGYYGIISIKSIVSFLLASLFWVLLYPILMRYSLKTNTYRYIKNGKANDFIGGQSVELGEECIKESNSTISSEIKYSAVERISFGHNNFYIYIGAMRVIIISISAFKNKEQQDTFFKMLSQKTGLDIPNVEK
jgi:hypothetical protein